MGPGCQTCDELTTWRWRSFSVLWLYQGSSRSGDHCQAYFRMVLMTALLIKMHRYTTRKAFIDLQGVEIRKRNLLSTSITQVVGTFIILLYSGALLRFRLVVECHLGLHTSVDRNS